MVNNFRSYYGKIECMSRLPRNQLASFLFRNIQITLRTSKEEALELLIKTGNDLYCFLDF